MPKSKTLESEKKETRFLPYARGFKRPTERIQISAIGCTKPEFHPAGFFSDITRPTSIDDWLAQYAEEGQTYCQFLEECPWLSRRKRKYMNQTFFSGGKTILEKYPNGKIYLLPLGDFSGKHCVNFQDLQKYAEIYLGIPVVALPGIKLEIKERKVVWVEEPENNSVAGGSRSSTRTRKHTLNSRYNEKTKHYQICVDQALLQLRSKIPSDAICMIGLTMSDLYGDETDLFVAGMAAGNHRVAVFSFYRYDPIFTFSPENWFDVWRENNIPLEERKRLILQRSCKLLVHEISHLLGIDHCVFFDCCMNGSGHLEEDYRQPIHLCPVDLHKLQKLVGFNIIDRYKKLSEFYKEHGMTCEFDWVTKRIDYLMKQP